MKYFIASLYLFMSAHTFACKLSIPESYVTTFLNPPVSGHYEKCEDRPSEKCHCVESVDPWATDFIDGELVHNSDKAFAREHSENMAREAEKAKEEKCKTFSFKGATIAALRQELNESMECRQ